jgi:hypothetical protein
MLRAASVSGQFMSYNVPEQQTYSDCPPSQQNNRLIPSSTTCRCGVLQDHKSKQEWSTLCAHLGEIVTAVAVSLMV